MNVEIKNNYYEVLAVGPAATQHDILIAYEKAKRTYSSQNKSLYDIFSEEEATALRKLVDEAYAVLGNPNYRNIYEHRMQAKTFTDNELTLDAIKKASETLFQAPLSARNPSETKEQSYQKDEKFESEIAQQSAWSGDFLQKVREYKNISIERLHETTKVNPWYLKALENMDAHNLPAPVFVRGYVIQLAKSLGLNDKVVADSYMKLYKEKIEHKK